ncbi:transposase [Brucella sp. NF 2653]|nr:transposase [Brucella sp. NF 2653]
MSRGDLSESEWRVLKDLLPIEAVNRGRGRRPEQNRAIINGILWRLHCGTPWRDVPPKYGNWNTIYRQFRRWSEAGVLGVVSSSLLRSWLTVATIASTAPRFAPILRQRAEKGDSSTCYWPLAGRVHQ